MRAETAAGLAAEAMLISGVFAAMQPPTNAMLLRAPGSAVNNGSRLLSGRGYRKLIRIGPDRDTLGA